MSQHQGRTGPIQNDAAAFSPEMVAGWHPDRNCAFPPKNQGWSDSQVTFITQMTPEMFAGWHPDTPRLPFIAKRGLQSNQTTFDAAPFTPDMVAGWHADRPRLPFAAKYGWQDSQLTFLVQMTTEMFQGSRPDSPRIFLGPRIPLPIYEVSGTAAAFSQEMVLGWQPKRNRAYMPPLGYAWSPYDTIIPPVIRTPYGRHILIIPPRNNIFFIPPRLNTIIVA